MRGLLKTELKKAFRSPWFASAVLIGFACALWCLWDATKEVYGENGWFAFERYCMESGIMMAGRGTTLYTTWLGMSESTAHVVFYRLFPILALLPCGMGISEELNGGYVKAVVPIVGRKKYFSAKLLAAFLAGGAAVCLPLLINLAATAAFVPAIRLSPYDVTTYAVSHGDLFSAFSYSHPLLYALAFIGVDFVFGGLFACLALPVALRSEKRVAAVVIPYIALLLADAAKGFLYYISYMEISPMDLVSAQRYNMARPWIYGAWLAILVGVNLLLGLWKGAKRDIV